MDTDRRLVIVRRGHFATFELLTRTFSDDSSVQVVWDRRIAERRAADSSSADERRSDRRRRPPTQWGQLNYMIAATVGAGNATSQ